MKFVPYHQLEGRANIIVDGTPHPHTQLTLSHWKSSGTPKPFLADTSAEIVLRFLEAHSIPSGLECVSNNHFDQDGLVGIFALLNPEYSLSNKNLLIDVAEAGDFSKFRDRRAARISFTIAEMVDQITDEEQSKGKPYPELCAHLYQVLLPHLRDIIEHLDHYEEYWKEEDEFLKKSEENIKEGRIKLLENTEAQVTLIEIPLDLVGHSFHWATFKKSGPVHEMAIHNRTPLTQLVYRQGNQFWFQYRYESWVTFQSTPFPLRVDLALLCSNLNALEKDGGNWTFSGTNDLVPILSRQGESSIDFEVFLNLLFDALKTAPVGWNPFS